MAEEDLTDTREDPPGGFPNCRHPREALIYANEYSGVHSSGNHRSWVHRIDGKGRRLRIAIEAREVGRSLFVHVFEYSIPGKERVQIRDRCPILASIPRKHNCGRIRIRGKYLSENLFSAVAGREHTESSTVRRRFHLDPMSR